ncbi:MAG: hypothetical protein A2Z37_12120 [Chloroflexi bacterium RBG_19FT_COMBO_62_14]|nr:MAG: hypothetical protein A2Z37_12120 [Chloroflexi bacterium RBG_19FT_COMBO_62_14]
MAARARKHGHRPAPCHNEVVLDDRASIDIPHPAQAKAGWKLVCFVCGVLLPPLRIGNLLSTEAGSGSSSHRDFGRLVRRIDECWS